MERGREARRDLFGVAIVAALIALALAFGAQRGRRTLAVVNNTADVTALSGPAARYALSPASGRLEVTSQDGRSKVEIEMSLVVDGLERPLVMRRTDVHVRDRYTLVGDFPIDIGGELATGTLELRMDPMSDLLTVSVAVAHEAASSDHTYALRFGLAPESRSVFIPGSGDLAGPGNSQARSIVVDDDVHPFAFMSSQGPLSVGSAEPDTSEPRARPRLIVSAATATALRRAMGMAPGKPARLDVSVLVGASSQALWGRLYQLSRVRVAKVSGVVTGTTERARVFALDEEGHPRVRAIVDPQGRFTIEAPTTAVQWFAALEAVHTSAPVRFMPGTPWDLKLDVSAGGELFVKVVDGDTRQPLVARLIVKGIEGTLDPSFGPDYRASGAGPLMDILEGEVKTPLPAGKYLVSATKGIEWSIDAQTVEIVSGHTRAIELAPRHVVPTPGMVGCDLHVHARPSFDSPVTPEDRVLSLVSAGIDFAVPTEHNMVGDYTPALEVLRLNRHLSHVSGVEVTTYNPRFGHFGVFPYPTTSVVPPYRGTTVGAMVAASKRSDPSRVVQINHPRLPQNIGYFNIINFDPKGARAPTGISHAFDTLEVYNGYELARRELTERVMEDWFAILNFGKRMAATGSSDSHRIQYQWAGYPRTYALVDVRSAGDTGQPIDTERVVAAIKKGRSFVTSGPTIEFELYDGGRLARPGDDVPRAAAYGGKLKVRAAPWIDVTGVEILAGVPPSAAASHGATGPTVSLYKRSIASIPTEVGKSTGTLEEASERTVRLDTDISIKPPESARWIVVVVRGERRMDDALPFMGVQPLAFTNPVYLGR